MYVSCDNDNGGLPLDEDLDPAGSAVERYPDEVVVKFECSNGRRSFDDSRRGLLRSHPFSAMVLFVLHSSYGLFPPVIPRAPRDPTSSPPPWGGAPCDSLQPRAGGRGPAQDLKLLATPPLRPNQYLCPLSTQYSAHNNHMPYNLQLKQTTVNPTIDLLLYESGITAPLTSSGRN